VNAVCQAISGRLATYRVVVADNLTLGFIRLDASAQQWIARTASSETSTACMRRFDVQPAVAAVIAACHRWEPTEVPVSPPLPGPPTGLTEADVCGFIRDPAHQVWDAVGVFFLLALIVAVVCATFGLHRLPGAVWRLARRLYRRVTA
jgi:hypothetical protein